MKSEASDPSRRRRPEGQARIAEKLKAYEMPEEKHHVPADAA